MYLAWVTVASTNGTLLHRLLGWTGSFGMSDARAFLQARVTFYAKIIVGILASFWVFARLGYLAHGYDVFLATLLDPLSIAHLALTIGMALDWAFLSHGERKLWMLHAYESVGTIMLSALIGLMVHMLPDGMSAMVATPMLALILVVRASMVPSSAVRTIAIGLTSTAALCVATYLTLEPGADPLDFGGRAVQVVTMAGWGVAFSVITGIISRVIYGLTERVREALELGQYRLVEKLGEGAMGAVYRAEHALLKRPTAVKLLPPDKAGDEAIRRFEREVVETSNLANPHTVAIYDFGRTPDGLFYYAMEYLDGPDLQDLVEIDGPQAPGRVVHILHGMAESLREAHAEGLVHRDVKPANVMIMDHRGGLTDMVKLVDFGLVQEVHGVKGADGTENVLASREHAIVGTPLYLAPEAITAPDDVDGRADIYALGAVAYFLLTGGPVFEAQSVVEVCADHLHSPPVSPSVRLGKSLPTDFEALVLRCLAKEPGDRFDADGLIAALDALDVAPWTDTDAQAWWRSTGNAVHGYLESKRGGSTPPGPMSVTIGQRHGTLPLGGETDKV